MIGFMKFMYPLILLISLSCAKFAYLTEQGIGQARLQWKGVDNETILKDPKVSDAAKRKIELVEEYKKFFYHYFSSKPKSIYTKTTMLDGKAVTYLVIASQFNKIEANEFSFPFMGSFPYLGFFNQYSAKKFAKGLEDDENLVTWVRPVYAYSTLGYLEDRILSSFFEYDDVELAELVFHELFHTVFFIKNEVDLNENLANFYGKELLKEYFKGQPQLDFYFRMEQKKKKINLRIVELVGILKTEFSKLGGFLTKEKASELTERFVSEVFRPDIKNLCLKLEIEQDDCELKDEWNQARFAAFMTYEEEQDFIEKLMLEKKLNLKNYLGWLKQEYKAYESQKEIQSFTDYLKMKVPHAPIALDRSP
jgi:hypothetical protein